MSDRYPAGTIYTDNGATLAVGDTFRLVGRTGPAFVVVTVYRAAGFIPAVCGHSVDGKQTCTRVTDVVKLSTPARDTIVAELRRVEALLKLAGRACDTKAVRELVALRLELFNALALEDTTVPRADADISPVAGELVYDIDAPDDAGQAITRVIGCADVNADDMWEVETAGGWNVVVHRVHGRWTPAAPGYQADIDVDDDAGDEYDPAY